MQRFERLRDALAPHDAVLLDIWGVLHDGRRPYPRATAALDALLDSGRPVAMLTNASYTGARVAADLQAMGFRTDGIAGIVTAGDVTKSLAADLIRARGRNVWFIGEDEHLPLLEGLDVRLQQTPDGADVVFVASGEADPAALAAAQRAGLPLVCANPDKAVHHLDGTITRCAGAVAEDYARLGGAVLAAGKPHPPIFAAGRALLGACRSPVLIGDTPETDLFGAHQAGMDALWLQRLPAPADRLARARAQQPRGWLTDFA